MTMFRVKRQEVALFDVVDNRELLREAFSKVVNGLTLIDVSDDALDHIAEAIGVDVEDDLRAIGRFAGGRWRDHVGPPGASTLGTFGEVLSYLDLLTRGRKPLRIVSYQRGPDEDPDVSDFPVPDYLVEENGLLGCVEVKTSCALDYRELAEIVTSANKRRRSQLAPCLLVLPRWKEALRQLGHAGPGTTPKHRLVLRNHGVVPFPSSFGVAQIHLVHDRRLDALRVHENAARMKTPSDCIAAKRNCWTCMEGGGLGTGTKSPADVVTLDMHNAPGHLEFLGSGTGDVPLRWRTAYEAWSRGLWGRDPIITGQADIALTAATEQWLQALQRARDDSAAMLVRGELDRYLGTSAAVRGMRQVAIRERFPSKLMTKGMDRERHIPSREPEVETVESLAPDTFAQVARRRVRVEDIGFSLTVGADGEDVELRALSRAATPLTTASATSLLASLVRKAIEAFHVVPVVGREVTLAEVTLAEVQPITVRWADHTPSFGWRLRGTAGFRSVVGHLHRGGATIPFGTAWTIALGHGDPRVSLAAYPDGRARLRFPRSLLDRGGIVFFN